MTAAATTTRLDRAFWPPTKVYDVVQVGLGMIDVCARQDTTKEELEEVSCRLTIDLIAFRNAGRKLS